jgi:predicted acetyltransferase
MPSAVTTRPATEPDLDRLIEVHAACYPDERGAGARRLNFVQNALGRLDDLLVAERDGRIVGHGFGFSLAAHFGGAAVRVLGIASLGVAPEARGTGVAEAVLDALEDRGRARGAVVALLHAFRHGFYARRGFADVTPNHRLACDPRAVPAEWTRLARGSVRATTGKDTAQIIELYGRAAARANGWIERPEGLWARRLANERLHFLVVDGAGYVSFELGQREPHAMTRLFVHDLVAVTDEARRALFGVLGMQAGQVAEIEVEVAADDPVAFALTDADGARFGDERVEHDLGCIVAGPMLRLLDPPAALAARGWPRDGDADLDVAGRKLHVTARGGGASVTDAGRGGLALDERALASVAFGGLRARDAARLGLAKGDDAAVADADELLRTPPFFTLDRF